MRLWDKRVRIIGDPNRSHIRFTPNPGFRLQLEKGFIKWNWHYGWNVGD